MPLGRLPQRDLAGRKTATVYRAVYGVGDSWIARYVLVSSAPEAPEDDGSNAV